MDLSERLLEYALWRLHHEPAPSDLAQRVRAAWERGAPGPDLGAWLAAFPHAGARSEDGPFADEAPRRPAPGRRRRRGLAWTLALAGAGAALALVLRSGSRAAPLGRLEAPLARRAADARGAARGTWSLARGSLALGSGEPAWTGARANALILAGGGSARLAPATLFALETRPEGVALVLEWGAVVLEAPPASGLELVAPQTRVALAAGARLAAELAWDRATPPPQSPGALEATRERLAAGALGRLELRAERGSVQVTVAGERADLAPGEPLVLALETRGPRRLEPQALDDLDRELERLARAELVDPPLLERAFGELVGAALGDDALALELTRRLEPRLADPALPPASRRRLVDLLSLIPGPSADGLARRHFERRPEDFGVDAQIAFAERGQFPFPDEVRAIVEHDDPLAREPWIAASDRPDALLPAVLLALRGDGTGAALLRRTADEGGALAPEGWRALVAARALERLAEPEPWRAVRAAAAREIARLADGPPARVQEAARLALTWEAVEEAIGGPAPPRVAHLAWRLRMHVAERLAEVGTRASVLALLERLRGR